MYILRKKTRRRTTPIRRKKHNAIMVKRFITVLLILFLLLAGFFVLWKAAGWFFNSEKRPSWMEWHLKKVNIYGESGPITDTILKYLSLKEGDSVSYNDALMLEKLLNSNIRELKKVRVNRNFFNGNLNIKIEKHIPFVRLAMAEKTYLAEAGGVVFNDEKLPENSSLFEVFIEGGIKDEKLPKEFVKLIEALKEGFVSDIKKVSINSEENIFELELKSGKAEMSGIKNGPEKLKRLRDVLAEAEKRGFKKPYTINFNYFDDGKIYLIPAE